MFRTESRGIVSIDTDQIFRALDRVGLKVIKNRNNQEVMKEAEPLIDDIVSYFSRFKGNDFINRYIEPSHVLDFYNREYGYYESDFGYCERTFFSGRFSYLNKPLTIAKHLGIKNKVTEIPQTLENEDSYKIILPDEIVDLYNRETLIWMVEQLEDYHKKLEEVYKNLSSYEPLSPSNYLELIESYLDNQFHDYVPRTRKHGWCFTLKALTVNIPNRVEIFKDLISRFYASLKVHQVDPFLELHKLLHWWRVTHNNKLYDEEFFEEQLKDYILSEDKTYNLGLLELGVYDAFEEIVNSF